MSQFIKILTWFPIVSFWIVFAISAFFYFKNKFNQSLMLKLAGAVILVRILNAISLTVGQYYVWAGDTLGKTFLNSPLDLPIDAPIIERLSFIFKSKLGYFVFYSYGRFWLNVFVTALSAFIFYLFLKFLKKRKERFFYDGEVELGFLCALIVGWPNFVIFVPLSFLMVVIISIIRGVFLKEPYTTLGAPFLFATFLILIWGEWFVKVLNLMALKA